MFILAEMSNNNSNLIDEAKNINSSLRRVTEMMKVNVERAQHTSEAVNQDGEIIKDTLDEQKYSLKSALDYTNRSLRAMKIAQFMEKYSLYVAFGVYLLAITYVLLKRTGILGLVYRSFC